MSRPTTSTRRHSIRLVAALIAATGTALVPAWASPDKEPLQQVVEDFVRRSTHLDAGDIDVTVNSRPLPAPCRRMEAFMPAAARLSGRTNVGVRCVEGATWSLWVPTRIRRMADYWVAARPLAHGDPIEEADLIRQRGDLYELPAGVVTDLAQAVGRVPALSIGAGLPLRAEMLREQPVILQGQTVRVIAKGASFQITSEGRALASAAPGQVVQIRTPAGQTVSGIASGRGTVEITF